MNLEHIWTALAVVYSLAFIVLVMWATRTPRTPPPPPRSYGDTLLPKCPDDARELVDSDV